MVLPELLVLLTLIAGRALSQLVRLAELPVLHTCCPLSNLKDHSVVTAFNCDFEKDNSGGVNSFSYRWNVPPGLVAWTDTFELQYRNTTCEGDERTVTVPIAHILPIEDPDNNNNGAKKPATFLPRSYFRLDTDWYHSNEYCLNKVSSASIEIRVCEPTCLPTSNPLRLPDSKRKRKKRGGSPLQRWTACIRKCCDPGKSIKLGQGLKLSCLPTEAEFRPPLYSEKLTPLSRNERDHVDFHLSKLPLKCEFGSPQFFPFSREMVDLFGFSNICFRAKWDGKVYFLGSERRWIAPETYCMDSVLDFRDNSSASADETLENEMGIVMCPVQGLDEFGTSRKLYGGLMISSSVFLLLTFIVYLLLWDQHGLHGWTTLGHSGSMFLMYIFLGTVHILQVQAAKGMAVLKTMECVAVGVLAHFFLLATFCWLTLISFDLWYTFRSFNPKSSKSKSVRRFCLYVFFGWGVPTIVVVTALLLDKRYTNDHCSTVVLAGYGQLSCYVNPNALGEYIYYPISVLLLLNMVFFGVTTWKLYQYRQSTRIATHNLDSKRQFFKLFVKLFCVMGVTWIFEVVSFLHVGTQTPWYWNVVDSLNVCQAIAVFIIYVCKKETVFALKRQYPCLKVILDPLITLFRCRPGDAEQTSSSSMRRSYDKTRTSLFSKSARRSATGSTTETDT